MPLYLGEYCAWSSYVQANTDSLVGRETTDRTQSKKLTAPSKADRLLVARLALVEFGWTVACLSMAENIDGDSW